MNGTATAPKCATCHTNDATADGDSYFRDCEACFDLNIALAPHFHHPTDHHTRAVFVGCVLVARRCSHCQEALPLKFNRGSHVTPYLIARPTTRDTIRTLPATPW
ncbi:hypothetical protein ACFY05_31790 [Microtetraspora fusca]|uniref:RNHCP domain-containing protein n=1 Tax=Microtetraspora fusca TaxID=1997 RepID=A0ABW6VDS3_MICFU